MLDSGVADDRDAAVAVAFDALARAVIDRGRAEYRLSVADTEAIVVPGLTWDGRVDLSSLRRTVASLIGR